VVIFGHYHFATENTYNNVKFISLNGTRVAINDKAIYYIITDENNIFSIKKEVNYDYQKLYDYLSCLDYLNKNTFGKCIRKTR